MRAVVVLAALALAACGDDGQDHDLDAPAGDGDGGIDAPASPRETVTRSVTLGAGASDEAETRLNASGDKIRVRIMTGVATLAWNVHTHSAGETQTLIEESGVDLVDYEIVGPPNQYSLLLVNASGTLTFDVHFDLYGQAEYLSGL